MSTKTRRANLTSRTLRGITLWITCLLAFSTLTACTGDLSGLIQGVEINRQAFPGSSPALTERQVCSGEVVEVKVTPLVPILTEVSVNGYPGEIQYLSMTGLPTKLPISVSASVPLLGQVGFRTEEVEILDCTRFDVPKIRSQASLYQPFGVDFTITNVDELSGWQLFYWNFGDGQSAVTDVPTVSHSYEEATNGEQAHESFVVTLSNLPLSDGSAMVRRHTVTIEDYTRIARKKGIVTPRAWETAPFEKLGDRFLGQFRLRNMESEPLLLTHAVEQHMPCEGTPAEPPRAIPAAEILFQSGYDLEEAVDPQSREGIYMNNALAYGSFVQGLPADALVAEPSAEAFSMLQQSDPILLPELEPGIEGSVLIPATTVHNSAFVREASDFAEDTCVVAYHFKGTTPSERPVVMSLYYEIRPDPATMSTVVDEQLISFLTDLVEIGAVEDPTRITTQDLFRLQQSGLIVQTGEGWTFAD